MAQTKRDRYELLCKQVESLAAGETNVVGVLANVSAAMKTMFPEEFFWVGFYKKAPGLEGKENASSAGCGGVPGTYRVLVVEPVGDCCANVPT